jgi:DNA polymerase I-like protein with 3'-5' exonuclease and polymerase domains
MFYQKDEEDVTSLEYNVSKNVTYASNYMAGIPTITRTINKQAAAIGRKVTEAEVAVINRAYLDVHPLEEYWQDVARELRHSGTLTNALGFKRTFYNPNFHDKWKEGLAFYPQSTVASLINRSLLDIWTGLDRPGTCELVLQIHDELLFRVRKHHVLNSYRKIKEIMEHPFEIDGTELYIPVSGKRGRRWESHRESDDPEMERMQTLE